MAVVNRETPDEFNNPKPHQAPDKSRVVNILNIARTLGSSALSLMTGLLAAALILYSGYVLYDSFYTQNTAGTGGWDLLQYKPEIIENGAAPVSGSGTLADITEDYRAWLTMYETNIDYAVMQGDDDLYYASHDIYGKSSLTGAIYLASANNGGFTDQYNLLYGHHMDNGAMFGALDEFTDESYFDSHREGVLVTGSTVYDLTTFAVLRTNAYEANVYYVNGKTAADVISFLESASPIIYRTGVANSSSKIIALSTCAAADTDGRLVVYAVMTPRDMTETQNGALTLRVARYEGVYDAQKHGVDVTVNLDGATIEYSTDDGRTWTKTPPLARYVNESVTVLVRASYPGMESVSAYCEIRIIPRLAVVTANNARKTVGTADPTFTATVTGTVGNDKLTYTVTRPRAGQDEAIGFYPDTIIASGDAVQLNGSYNVVYHPADFTIVKKVEPTPAPGRPANPTPSPSSSVEPTPAPSSPVEPTPAPSSLVEPTPSPSSFVDRFKPTGSSFGDRCWALVNLICLLITFYILFPLMHLRDKFGRARLLEDVEDPDETLEEKINRFRKRFRIGLGGEIVTSITALVAFILTEDMRLPMVLIDKWTPLMVLLMILCLGIDWLTVRLRPDEMP